MKRKSTLSTFLILSFLNLLIFPTLSGCGDDADEDAGNIDDISPEAKILSLSDADRETFCAWYVENAGMGEATTCTIDETEIELPAVTTAECLENLESQTDCAVSAYKACAPVMKADRCGFDLADCPDLAACLTPANDSPNCQDADGECMFRGCHKKMNVAYCIILNFVSLGAYSLITGENCDGSVTRCGIVNGLCYVSNDCED